MYKCGYQGCPKAYGTLNHLNAHVTMQTHGTKRSPDGRLILYFIHAIQGVLLAFTDRLRLRMIYKWRRFRSDIGWQQPCFLAWISVTLCNIW